MDINSLLQNVLQSTNQSNANLQAVANTIGAANANEQAVSAKVSEQASADIPLGLGVAQQSADIQAQQGTLIQQLQAQANLDPAAADNAYAQSLADLTVINSQRKAVGQQLTQLSSANLFDDPFQYVMAQLNLPVVTAKAAALENQAAVATQDVNARLDLLAKAKSTVVANTVDSVKDVQYKTAELKAREAQRALDMATAEKQSKIAGQLLQQANIYDKINDNQRQVVSMQIQAANWAESMAERREARAERATRAAEARAAKATKDVAEASLSAGLQAASMLLGYPRPIDFASFKVLPNSPQKRALASIADTGTLGAGLEDSWKTLVEAGPNLQGIVAGGNAGFAQLVKSTDAALDSYVSLARRTADPTGKLPSEKEARTLGVTKLESDLVASASDPKGAKALNSPAWDSIFNPYKSQYKVMVDSTEAGKLAGLKGNVVIETAKTLMPRVPTDAPNFRGEDEQVLLNAIGAMVAKGAINENDAAKQIATYYRTSAAYNKDMYQYGLVGLPTQTSYMVKIKVPGFLGDTTLPAANLMDETQTKKLLLTIAKGQATPTTSMGPGVTPMVLGAQSIGGWLADKVK